MNQLVGTKPDGSKFLALVLEPGNVRKLIERKPITIHVEDLFPDGIPKRLELAVFYSDTPIADMRDLAVRAEVTLDERTPVSMSKKPHCPECSSTVEQLGLWKNDTPYALIFCASCGCIFGVVPKPTGERIDKP